MIPLDALPRHVPGVVIADVTRWVELHYVRPLGQPGGWLFAEMDVARVRLLVELRYDLLLDEDALPTVLSLMDQLYDARRQLRALRHALDALPAETRQAVLQALPEPARARTVG